MNKIQKFQVEWYRKHGKYPERIRLDGTQEAYVVSDWSWNIVCPDKPEIIESLMREARKVK